MRLYKLEMRIVVIGVAVGVGKPVYRRVARRGSSCYIYVRAEGWCADEDMMSGGEQGEGPFVEGARPTAMVRKT